MAGEKQSKDGQWPDPDMPKITEQSEGIPGVNTPVQPGRPQQENEPQ